MSFFSKQYIRMLILPCALTLVALGALLVWGLRPSIDLAGGSFLEVSFTGDKPQTEEVQKAIEPLSFGEVRVQPAGERGYIIRLRDLSASEKEILQSSLGRLGDMKVEQFTSIGPTIGAEILRKGYLAMGLVIVSIVAFIAFAFRKVSLPVQSWKYGIVAIVSLIHDVLIPVGLFAYLGHALGAEVDSLFIVALLTILGISINDKIVVFDRIRENLQTTDIKKQGPFSDVVGKSIMQTLARSINTSLTVIIVLLALYFVGPAVTKYFALTLLAGMIAGTYSSIFLAAPLLIIWERWGKGK